jgi:tetratricopeptide (TPR) repeat protein
MLADQVAGYAILKETEKAFDKLDEFWERYSTAPDFVDKLLNIKNLCWWNENYPVHFAICERIAQTFPDDPKTIQVRADEVAGYLVRGDLEKAESLARQFLSEVNSGDAYVTFLNPVANHYNLKGLYRKADELYQYVLNYADADDGRLAITKMGQLASRIAATGPDVLQPQFDQVLTDYADDPNLVKGVLLAAEVSYHVGQKRRNADAAASDYVNGIRLLEEILQKTENDQDRSEAYYLMGHATGITYPFNNGHCNDSTCLMHKTSNNWKRDGHFCNDCRAKIEIHNN